MIVLVHGPDAATARAEVTALLRRHDPDGNNTTHLDGRATPLPRIIASVGSAGFFATGRATVVHDLMARAKKGGSGDADPVLPDGLDLASLFAAVPPESLLVLVDIGLSAVPASVRKAAPAGTKIIAAEPPRGRQLLVWLVGVARDEGAELDETTARLLAERLYPQTWAAKPANPRYDRPPDLDLLRGEVAKLALAAHPGPIRRGHIEEMVRAGDDDRVFRFVEAAAGGRLGAALEELDRLRAAGEEPFKLVAQVHQQVELAVVLEAAGPRIDAAAVGKALGVANPGRLTAIAASRRGQPPGSAARSVAAATAVDRQVKRGELRQPEDGTYQLLAALALAAERSR